MPSYTYTEAKPYKKSKEKYRTFLHQSCPLEKKKPRTAQQISTCYTVGQSYCRLTTDTHNHHKFSLIYLRNFGQITLTIFQLSYLNFVQDVKWDVLSIRTSWKAQQLKKKQHSLQNLHLYLCAIFAPKKPHNSSSILENVSSPLLPSPRRALSLSHLRSLSGVCCSFPISRSTRFFRAFSPSPLALLPLLWVDLNFSFFLCSCSSGLSRVVGQTAGYGSWFAEGGECKGGDPCEGVVLCSGPPTAPRRGLQRHVTRKVLLWKKKSTFTVW